MAGSPPLIERDVRISRIRLSTSFSLRHTTAVVGLAPFSVVRACVARHARADRFADLRGDGPPYIQVGRSIRYTEAALLHWIKSDARTSTNQA
jgi:hypothetical protein